MEKDSCFISTVHETFKSTHLVLYILLWFNVCSSFHLNTCAHHLYMDVRMHKCMNINYCYTKTLKYVKAVISDNIGKNLEKLGLIRGLQWNQIYENITHTKMLFISIR